MKDYTPISKAKALAKKIQFQFPSTPEGELMFRIVERALFDTCINPEKYKDKDPIRQAALQREAAADKASAISYLSGDMPHCELAGVSSEWVRRLVNDADLGFSVNAEAAQ